MMGWLMVVKLCVDDGLIILFSPSERWWRWRWWWCNYHFFFIIVPFFAMMMIMTWWCWRWRFLLTFTSFICSFVHRPGVNVFVFIIMAFSFLSSQADWRPYRHLWPFYTRSISGVVDWRLYRRPGRFPLPSFVPPPHSTIYHILPTLGALFTLDTVTGGCGVMMVTLMMTM